MIMHHGINIYITIAHKRIGHKFTGLKTYRDGVIYFGISVSNLVLCSGSNFPEYCPYVQKYLGFTVKEVVTIDIIV